MKKLNIIFTLIISSFFLLSSSVKADTYTYSIDNSTFSLLNDDFVTFKEKVENLLNDSKPYYIIYYDLNLNRKQVILFNSTIKPVFQLSDNFGIDFLMKASDWFNYGYISGSKYYGLGSVKILTLNNPLNSSVFSYYILDTNYPDLNYSGDNVFNILCNGLSYEIVNGNKIPTLYEIYLDNNSQEAVDPKAEVISNFYILVIDKIKLFTNYIATDYIILSSLVIFIFVAVIGLVRRLE